MERAKNLFLKSETSKQKFVVRDLFILQFEGESSFLKYAVFELLIEFSVACMHAMKYYDNNEFMRKITG